MTVPTAPALAVHKTPSMTFSKAWRKRAACIGLAV
jgi:hypothetical protein